MSTRATGITSRRGPGLVSLKGVVPLEESGWARPRVLLDADADGGYSGQHQGDYEGEREAMWPGEDVRITARVSDTAVGFAPAASRNSDDY